MEKVFTEFVSVRKAEKLWEQKDNSKENLTWQQVEVELQEWSLADMMQDDRFRFDQSLLLINTQYMLEEDFSAKLMEYKKSGVQMNACMVESFAELSGAIQEKFQDKLYVSSGVRDRKRQQELYEEDPSVATIPGASEHETGLCMDVYVAHYSGDGFLDAPAGQFVNKHCDEYGFIIRYPYYGKKITGIRFEPWHIRYVGQPHARLIQQNQLTLEEYILGMEQGVCYETEEYLILRQSPEYEILSVPEGCESYVVSPDNTGCYIITGKRNGSTAE